MDPVTITPRDLAAHRQAGRPVELIDVRTPVEFRELHAESARNVPLSDLDPAALMAARGDGQPLYVICRTGGRGRQASELFRAAGFPGVVNVEGGTQAWAECGRPVVRGPMAVSSAATGPPANESHRRSCDFAQPRRDHPTAALP